MFADPKRERDVRLPSHQSGRCQRRFNEARVVGLDATGWRLCRGYGIGSGEPQCQLTVRTDVAVDERRKRRGQGTPG
jgi:hypothetical protein